MMRKVLAGVLLVVVLVTGALAERHAQAPTHGMGEASAGLLIGPAPIEPLHVFPQPSGAPGASHRVAGAFVLGHLLHRAVHPRVRFHVLPWWLRGG